MFGSQGHLGITAEAPKHGVRPVIFAIRGFDAYGDTICQ